MRQVTREQVLGHRVAASGLWRETADPVALDVLDLGIQETNVGSARLALAARLPPGGPDVVTDERFVLLWSFRGAPHLQRRDDLDTLVRSLWPVSDADAFARLAAERKPLKAAGIDGLEAFAAAAEALGQAVDGATSKGDASTAVTAALASSYSYACRSCATDHVYVGLFQSVAPFAGVALEPDASPATLVPSGISTPIPPEAIGPESLIRAYLHLHAGASLTDAAGYLGTTRSALRSYAPSDVEEVDVDGRQGLVLGDDLDALAEASLPRSLVRLLPPSDPFLQARDRELLVGDPVRRKALWRILASPGAVLVDGEVAGTWRARLAGSRLQLDVEAFASLDSDVRAGVEEEAERVRQVRGAAAIEVRFPSQ